MSPADRVTVVSNSAAASVGEVAHEVGEERSFSKS